MVADGGLDAITFRRIADRGKLPHGSREALQGEHDADRKFLGKR